jgi:uncharacterized protein (TIGR03790 family)
MTRMKFFLILILALAPLFVRAGGDEVVVVFNTQLPESKTVAEHYAKLRQVPEKQIYGFSLTTNEIISRAEFHDALQLPLAEKLVENGLWKFGEIPVRGTNDVTVHVDQRVVESKIRYAVLCYGVPLKIAPDPDLNETNEQLIRPELRRNEAAVDSELAWLPEIKMAVTLAGPLENGLYATTNSARLTPTNGILLVARLDGPTAKIANALVDKAMTAESDGLWGRAYFDARGLKEDDSYFLGDRWILTGAEICRQLGFEIFTDTNAATLPARFPMSQIAIYAGWYDSDVSGPFTLPKVEFMPGAFAYHLHSFSASTIRSTTQGWVGPLLAKGATCTMGCVYEPYLAATPNVAFFLQALGNGYTFGEAAWSAQTALSWQTTVVGDPLYRPFGKPELQQHAELAKSHSPLIEWSFLRFVNLDIVRGEPIARLANFVENLPATATSAVLTEKFADLCERQGKPSSAIDAYEHALTLNPSPQQRIRLRLTLAEKLLAQGRDAEAMDDYNKLISEASDYPGKNSVMEKLSALEQKTVNTTNAPDAKR